MPNDHPFRNLLTFTQESKRLIVFLLGMMILGAALVSMGFWFEKQLLPWATELLRSAGHAFLVAAAIGVVYELGMRKASFKEMEGIVRDNLSTSEAIMAIRDGMENLNSEVRSLGMHYALNASLLKLGIGRIFCSRKELSPFVEKQLTEALHGINNGDPVTIDLMGFGLTSFFDQMGSYYLQMLKVAQALERSPDGVLCRMRVIFPHPESLAIIERANAQVKGRPTVENPRIAPDTAEYIDWKGISAGGNFQQLINSMERKSRLFTDIFQLGAGFFKDRELQEGDGPGISVRFTLLNPSFQYIRIGNSLFVETYHFGVQSLTRSGECLSTPDKESLIMYYDLGRSGLFASLIMNHFDYIWTHPKETVPWGSIFSHFGTSV